ncbi:cytochrome c oxidase subunit 2 [Sphingomonas zeicaulis]|uniref:cytochrome c oxidase subunit II n=1 Tax=Sphingomonas zeicaulis TaxID=1632740 RepID=UPI003D24B04E
MGIGVHRDLFVPACLILSACASEQSALSPFGVGADSILDITWVLAIGAAIIFTCVALLTVHAMRQPEHSLTHHQGMRVVLWLGAVLPAVLLGILLLFALPAMRPMATTPGDLKVAVDGRQFWWHVTYQAGAAPPFTTANEIRLPAGRTVVFELTAQDVLHSFWIPGLAGKMDMLPGRTNRLVVKAEKPGTYRGVCAEFCGLSHALMAFDVVVMPAPAFDRWLAGRRAATPPAPSPGLALFDRHGCRSCHTLSPTDTLDSIGPSLAGLGSRRTLAAGVLPMTEDAIAGFIRDPAAIKPGARMPSAPDMTDQDARLIARALLELR